MVGFAGVVAGVTQAGGFRRDEASLTIFAASAAVSATAVICPIFALSRFRFAVQVKFQVWIF